MSEEKKYGVDLVKKAIKFLYDGVMEGIEDLKDKKLSLPEILGFADNAYTGIAIGLKSGELWAQLKDIDTEEGLDLFAYVADLVKKLTTDEAEIQKIIDHAISAIQAEIAIYEKDIKPMIDIIKGLKK